jgi:hypothetical protein
MLLLSRTLGLGHFFSAILIFLYFFLSVISEYLVCFGLPATNYEIKTVIGKPRNDETPKEGKDV